VGAIASGLRWRHLHVRSVQSALPWRGRDPSPQLEQLLVEAARRQPHCFQVLPQGPAEGGGAAEPHVGLAPARHGLREPLGRQQPVAGVHEHVQRHARGRGEALGYMLNLAAGLPKFLDDHRVPLSNNAAERALRDLVLGRKNFYGSRSRRGTEVAAILYTLMERAKIAGISPKAYRFAVTEAAIRSPDAVLLPTDFTQRCPTL